MPNRTVYWNDDQDEYIDSLVEDDQAIDNRSQAVQYCINTTRQRDVINEGHDNADD